MQNLTTAHIAIGISVLSLLVSGLSLGWNIYREIGLKARVKVGVDVVEEVWDEGRSREKFIMIFAVNFGPGEVTLTGIALKPTRFQRLRGRFFKGVIKVSGGVHWGQQLPIKLAVGQQARLALDYNENCFLRMKHARVGVRDSFLREHWARRKRLRYAEATFRKDFPEASAESGRERVKA